MKYLFGPVNSRRLGLSQGIDILPAKICNFNCIYCEVGATTQLTCERREYTPTAAIIAEIDTLLARPARMRTLDVFTITGSGEPTLHSGIGRVIRYIKEHGKKPVAVLTNGSLLHEQAVRDDLVAADVVIPSLDAALPRSYRRINRPGGCCPEPAVMIEGLRRFCREFVGEVWLEVLFAKGMNDSVDDVVAMQQAIATIRPHRVQLNTVARPPLEAFAYPVTPAWLTATAAVLGRDYAGKVEILVDVVKDQATTATVSGAETLAVLEAKIEQMLQRRPCTATDIGSALRLDDGVAHAVIAELVDAGRIRLTSHEGKKYYQAGG